MGRDALSNWYPVLRFQLQFHFVCRDLNGTTPNVGRLRRRQWIRHCATVICMVDEPIPTTMSLATRTGVSGSCSRPSSLTMESGLLRVEIGTWRTWGGTSRPKGAGASAPSRKRAARAEYRPAKAGRHR